MMRSMTGFVSQSREFSWGMLTWELRTVNQRFLDVSLRLPESARAWEMSLRKQIQSNIKRGKVEATLKLQFGRDSFDGPVLNQEALHALSGNIDLVQKYFPSASINALEVLHWQGVMQKQDIEKSELEKSCHMLLQDCLSALVAQRATEGDIIRRFILDTLVQIESQQKIILEQIPVCVERNREQLSERAAALQIELDANRLEQEIALLVQKQDVSEEMLRLKAHIDQTIEVSEKGGVIGRRLDFLMQELNREANTTASKSVDTLITKAAMEMKVLIEQIREQVQNIE